MKEQQKNLELSLASFEKRITQLEKELAALKSEVRKEEIKNNALRRRAG